MKTQSARSIRFPDAPWTPPTAHAILLSKAPATCPPPNCSIAATESHRHSSPHGQERPAEEVTMSPDRETEASEDMLESIDELKERLSSMKRMMEERKATGANTKELFNGKAQSLRGTNMIDGNFLSFVFGGSLMVIVSVSIYAFYNLYHAVLKKFPSHHTEL